MAGGRVHNTNGFVRKKERMTKNIIFMKKKNVFDVWNDNILTKSIKKWKIEKEPGLQWGIGINMQIIQMKFKQNALEKWYILV